MLTKIVTTEELVKALIRMNIRHIPCFNLFGCTMNDLMPYVKEMLTDGPSLNYLISFELFNRPVIVHDLDKMAQEISAIMLAECG